MKPLPVFYILVFYIFIQFGWWAFLLVQLNNEVSVLKTEVLQLSHTDTEVFLQKQNELDEKLHKRWLMVVGEGTVFLMFLMSGIANVRRTFRRENELIKQQKNFLLSITHELKSPLSSIKLYLQTLQKHEVDKEKQQQFIANAIHDTDRLTGLVENILFAAQIENHSYAFRKEKISMSDVVQESANRVASPLPKKLSVQSSVEKNIYLQADKAAMISLVINLLENAIKYSPENSTVSLELFKSAEQVVLRVKDEGAGITEIEKKKIFQKFYRIGNEETRTNKGTGLGLFIVKTIAENHKGKIVVLDNSPKGSTFEVTFQE